jgi:hypothetical protein
MNIYDTDQVYEVLNDSESSPSDIYLHLMKEKEDEIIKNMMKNLSATLKAEGDGPTILWLHDTVYCLKKKYGKKWREISEAVSILIWHSWIFSQEHIEEVIPEFAHLAKEFRDKKTINGKEIPEEFLSYALTIFDPPYASE